MAPAWAHSKGRIKAGEGGTSAGQDPVLLRGEDEEVVADGAAQPRDMVHHTHVEAAADARLVSGRRAKHVRGVGGGAAAQEHRARRVLLVQVGRARSGATSGGQSHSPAALARIAIVLNFAQFDRTTDTIAIPQALTPKE